MTLVVIIALALIVGGGVYLDARHRDWTGKRGGAVDWTLWAILFNVLVLPFYISARRDTALRQR